MHRITLPFIHLRIRYKQMHSEMLQFARLWISYRPKQMPRITLQFVQLRITYKETCSVTQPLCHVHKGRQEEITSWYIDEAARVGIVKSSFFAWLLLFPTSYKIRHIHLFKYINCHISIELLYIYSDDWYSVTLAISVGIQQAIYRPRSMWPLSE